MKSLITDISPKDVQDFGCRNKMNFDNPIVFDHFDKNGKFLNRYETKNDITNEGVNTLFEVMFHSGTQILTASWYIGLINLSGFTALANTDVMNSHTGWAEATYYTESTRVAWGPVAAAARAITNTTPVVFDINTNSVTCKGVFITSVSTKGGTTGILWATALFGADIPLNSGDQLKGAYTVSA